MKLPPRTTREAAGAVQRDPVDGDDAGDALVAGLAVALHGEQDVGRLLVEGNARGWPLHGGGVSGVGGGRAIRESHE